jgi:hypothetical protein
MVLRCRLKKQSDLFKSGNQLIASIVDVDVSHDKLVEFNVSRDKIAIESSPYLRGAIRSSVIKCLIETQIMQQLSEETKDLLDMINNLNEKSLNNREYISDARLTQELLEKVCKLMPKDYWPKSVHKIIALELHIPNGLAWRAIDVLMIQGKLKKPRYIKIVEKPN